MQEVEKGGTTDCGIFFQLEICSSMAEIQLWERKGSEV